MLLGTDHRLRRTRLELGAAGRRPPAPQGEAGAGHCWVLTASSTGRGWSWMLLGTDHSLRRVRLELGADYRLRRTRLELGIAGH